MTIILPLFILITLLFALFNKVDAYNSFISGVKSGFHLIVTIFPIYLGMIFSTKIFIYSNFFNDLFEFLKISFTFSNEILLQGILRPISGSSSFSMMIEIFHLYGVDSKIGILSSVLQGSTDTTLYIITLYFGSIGIIHYKKAVILGLLVDLIGFIASVLIIIYLL